MTALGVGIVGARFAADLHAVNYRHLRGGRVELVAVCARTRADAEALRSLKLEPLGLAMRPWQDALREYLMTELAAAGS